MVYNQSILITSLYRFSVVCFSHSFSISWLSFTSLSLKLARSSAMTPVALLTLCTSMKICFRFSADICSDWFWIYSVRLARVFAMSYCFFSWENRIVSSVSLGPNVISPPMLFSLFSRDSSFFLLSSAICCSSTPFTHCLFCWSFRALSS